MAGPRPVFYVSDRTGITVETLGHTLLTQFEGTSFEILTLPYVDTPEKARAAAARIEDAGRRRGVRPIVFSTLVDPAVRRIVLGCDALGIDFFEAFIGPLERELQTRSTEAVGRTHGLSDPDRYGVRMDAVNFALGTDDGIAVQEYAQADVIVTGVSRSGKTPTCLYLALQFGIRAANYPVTEEELDVLRLPAALVPHRARLFGLTIDPQRLHQIRSARRPDSRYASLRQCQYEVGQVEALYRKEGIPHVNTTRQSVEEIATHIVHEAGLLRRDR